MVGLSKADFCGASAAPSKRAHSRQREMVRNILLFIVVDGSGGVGGVNWEAHWGVPRGPRPANRGVQDSGRIFRMFAEFGGLIAGTALTRARLHSQSEHSEEQIMKRKIGTTILLVAASCLGLSAQTIDLKANIPFRFQVGQVEMPD